MSVYIYICFFCHFCQIVVSVTLYIIKICLLSHFDINIKQKNTKPGEIINYKCSESMQKLLKKCQHSTGDNKKM